MTAYDISQLKAELSDLRKERKQLIEQYGDKGQRHPSNIMIGGLNPAAMRLYNVRNQIALLESRLSEAQGKSPPKVQEIAGTKNKYGLKYDIVHGLRSGKLGTDNFGKWYVVENGEIIADNLPKLADAKSAFVKAGK